MSVAALWAFGLEMQNMFHLLLETNPRGGDTVLPTPMMPLYTLGLGCAGVCRVGEVVMPLLRCAPWTSG